MSLDATSAAALFSPARLTQARQLLAITRADLARQADVSPAAVSQYESGAIRPRPATLAQIALALGVPLSFLTEPPRELTLPHASRAFFRSLRSTTMRERERAAAHAGLVAQLLAEVDRRVELPTFLPFDDLALSPEDPPERAEFAAGQVRERWDLGDDPIDHVVRLLERHGVVVARLPFENASVDAFSWTDGPRPLVVLGTEKGDYERSRFDASHELAHVLLHAADPEPANASMERQAHRFASALLLPAQDLRERWPAGRLDWSELLKIKNRSGASLAAILYRAKDLEILSAAQHQSAMKYLSRRWGRRREPGHPYPLEAPKLLNEALGLLEQHGTTLDQLAADARLLSAEDLKTRLGLAPRPPLRLA